MDNIDSQKEKWAVIKSRGKKNYLLIYGILPYMAISVLLATFHIFILNRTKLYRFQDIIITYLVYLTGWCLVGLFLGNMMWNSNVKRRGK